MFVRDIQCWQLRFAICKWFAQLPSLHITYNFAIHSVHSIILTTIYCRDITTSCVTASSEHKVIITNADNILI